MKEFFYEVKHFGFKVAIGNAFITLGGRILGAKTIRITYRKNKK